MKREFTLKISRRIKENFSILIQTLKGNKKTMAEEEDKVVATITEDEEEDAIMSVIIGGKEMTGGKGHVSYAFVVTKQGTMSMIVPIVCLNFKKHKRVRIIAHMKPRS